MDWDSIFPRYAIILAFAVWALDAHCLYEAQDSIDFFSQIALKDKHRPEHQLLGLSSSCSVFPAVSLLPGPDPTTGPLHLLSPCLESPPLSYLWGLIPLLFQAFAQMSAHQGITS